MRHTNPKHQNQASTTNKRATKPTSFGDVDGRYATLTLDLANQLVSNVHMEGGAAKVVVFLIEAAARAGARDMGCALGAGSSGSGGGGSGGGGGGGGLSSKRGGYFMETVEYVALKARVGLEQAREAQRQSVSIGNGRGGGGGSSGGSDGSSSSFRRELLEKEEACLTLLQGLSGFTR